MVIAAHANVKAAMPSLVPSLKIFSGSQNYKISITLRMYPTGFCAQSFYKYSFFS